MEVTNITNITNPLVCLEQLSPFSGLLMPIGCRFKYVQIAGRELQANSLCGLFILFLLGRLSLLPRITLSSSESSERQENRA